MLFPALNMLDKRIYAFFECMQFLKTPKSCHQYECELACLITLGIVEPFISPCQPDHWKWYIGVLICFKYVIVTWGSWMGSRLLEISHKWFVLLCILHREGERLLEVS